MLAYTLASVSSMMCWMSRYAGGSREALVRIFFRLQGREIVTVIWS